MHKGRLEAFSDGVLAIIITIMVLELKVPHDVSIAALHKLAPVFLSYVLSFIFVAIYWVNHHHLFQATKHVDGPSLWANIHLLFWLSLVPFASGWMGENRFGFLPVVAYGIVLLACALAFLILEKTLLRANGPESHPSRAIGKGVKEKLSLSLYVVALPLAWVSPYLSLACFAAVALVWFIPDRRIEKAMGA